MSSSKVPRLIVRNAKSSDLRAIQRLSKKVYPDAAPYSLDNLRGQLNNFSEGQFVALYEDKIVGYCATVRIDGAKALQPHTWREITGGGFGSTHNPSGNYLYGMEVFVDTAMRGLRIGARLYQERKKLCRHLRLKGIVFGGRMPLLAKRFKVVGSAERYLEEVKNKRRRDPVISFQMRNGFEIIGLLPNYLPDDRESLGYAAHMLWKNPEATYDESDQKKFSSRLPDTVRVATVQYMQRGIDSFEDFERIVDYFVDVVADYRSDFVLFPELFTMQLLSIENNAVSPAKAIKHLSIYTDRLREMFSNMALKYNVNIIAGSHPSKNSNGSLLNISYIYLRDGSVHEQAKIHPTPNERYWWGIEGGDQLSVIETDCGPIGVLICYDCEFPELARHLANQGVNIVFVPFCTDERQSYMRVRYCAQARAVENQCYVVLSGNVGNLPRVQNMDIQYAQSCILTPCDMPFARDGIAADTTPNMETVAFADLRLETLSHVRANGTVQNLRDRRHELYSVVWHKPLTSTIN